MKKFNSVLMLLAVLLTALTSFAQADMDLPIGVQAKEWSPDKKWLHFEASIPLTTFFEFQAYILNTPNETSWKLLNQHTDKRGYTHMRYQQVYQNTPIRGAVIILHTVNNKVESLNGNIVHETPPLKSAKISKEKAIEIALEKVHANQYAWEVPFLEEHLQNVKKDKTASHYPNPTLVYFDKDFDENGWKFQLAYELTVYAVAPHFHKEKIYLNAVTGLPIHSIGTCQHIDVEGTAETKYHGTRTLTTDSIGVGQYRLRDGSRGNGIKTLNLQEGDDSQFGEAVDFVDDDNYWNNVNEQQDEAATDAHWGAQMVYDYYYSKFDRNSIDDEGFELVSYVHFAEDWVNAAWTGTEMIYGDGDSIVATALTSLDICGHEITHGLIQYTGNMEYEDEPGALNESIADIFGMCVDYHANPEGFNWQLAEQVFIEEGAAIRDISNPNAFEQPDTYHGDHWYFGAADYGGVHTNSGVMNYWFYLLATGGSGTNDNGDDYMVDSIGILKVEQIVYQALTSYMTVTSNYSDARAATIQATIDLYGICSEEYITVINAWFAVGVGTPIFDFDLGIEIPSLSSSCDLGDDESIEFVITNYDCNENIPVGSELIVNCTINNDVITDTIILVNALEAGDTYAHTLSQTLDFTQSYLHTIVTELYFESDSFLANNIDTTIIENYAFGGVINIVSIDSPDNDHVCTNNNAVELPISLEVTNDGCSNFLQGTPLIVEYKLNEDNWNSESVSLSEDFLIGDTIIINLNNTINAAVGQNHKLYFKTQSDSVVVSFTVQANSFNVGTFIDFESEDYLSHVTTESGLAVQNSLTYFNGTNENVFDATSTNPDLSDQGGADFPESEDVIWNVYSDFHNELRICTEVPEEGSLLVFDYLVEASGLYNLALPSTPYYLSMFKVLINGEQIGTTYGYDENNSSITLEESIDLSAYAGEEVSIVFKTSTFLSDNYGGYPFEGDHVYLDNIHFAEPTGIEETIKSITTFNVNPSLANDWVNILVDAKEAFEGQLQLISTDGKVIIHENIVFNEGEQSYQLSLSNIPSGIYVVRILTSNNESMFKRIVIQH